MKFCFITTIFIFAVIQTVYCQDKSAKNIQSLSNNYDFYKRKASLQKKYGWVAVSAGIALYGIGITQSTSNYYIDNDPSKGYPPSKRTPYFIAGTLAELASIPFFIAAKNNKKRAVVAVKNESALLFKLNNSVNYPAIFFAYQL